ncbi:GNAT family N-acetyltransferase [Halosegnis marinus]|uniref:GNAT family N-acetyltransferase n=1 Tax=Halosegnis marinus TaxID=3034023 RepID=A0ABD5ZLE2_9EURY|nr:GNAT family N-acetyltransferase [Halosegnis sp. DT85]
MIRPATAADRPAVRELQKLLDHRAPALLEAAFDTEVRGIGGDAFVADDGGVVGYALAVPGARDADPSVVYLAELAVAPGVRREGYGRRLVAALADGYDHDQLRVTVAADDDGARAFYTAAGFWELADLPDRFDGADGVLLVRDLS